MCLTGKSWFLLRRTKQHGGTYNLFYDYSVAAVVKRAGVSLDQVNVTPMSWRGMRELTGCNVPMLANDSAIAKGALMFNCNGRYWNINA